MSVRQFQPFELERIRQAQAMSPEEKLLLGPVLFERACRIMADGIRAEYPALDAAGILAKVRERVRLTLEAEEYRGRQSSLPAGRGSP
jgi:hypothetical protein